MYRDDITSVARSPTKLAEYLACGLPIAAPSLGDIPHLFAGTMLEKGVFNFGCFASYVRSARYLSNLNELYGVKQILDYYKIDNGVENISKIYESLDD